MQLAKEEQARKQARNLKGKGSDNTDREAPEHEKARLLSTENRDAIGLSTEVDLEARMPQDRPRMTRNESSALASEGEADQNNSEQSPVSTSTNDAAQSKSEKARGKMRERQRSESVDMSGSLERIAAAGVGRNGFVPTQDWVTSWHQG